MLNNNKINQQSVCKSYQLKDLSAGAEFFVTFMPGARPTLGFASSQPCQILQWGWGPKPTLNLLGWLSGMLSLHRQLQQLPMTSAGEVIPGERPQTRRQSHFQANSSHPPPNKQHSQPVSSSPPLHTARCVWISNVGALRALCSSITRHHVTQA